MKTKLFFITVLSVLFSFSANAQLQGKKFTADFEGIGKINLEFKEKIYELSTPAAVVIVKGNYEIEEKKITFTDTEGPIACQENVKGEYEFEYNNEVLTLTIIQDACPGRKSIASADWEEVD